MINPFYISLCDTRRDHVLWWPAATRRSCVICAPASVGAQPHASHMPIARRPHFGSLPCSLSKHQQSQPAQFSSVTARNNWACAQLRLIQGEKTSVIARTLGNCAQLRSFPDHINPTRGVSRVESATARDRAKPRPTRAIILRARTVLCARRRTRKSRRRYRTKPPRTPPPHGIPRRNPRRSCSTQ